MSGRQRALTGNCCRLETRRKNRDTSYRDCLLMKMNIEEQSEVDGWVKISLRGQYYFGFPNMLGLQIRYLAGRRRTSRGYRAANF